MSLNNTAVNYIKQAEVINPKSYYFGEDMTITDSITTTTDVWYKALMEYRIGLLSNVSVWFKESELGYSNKLQ